MTDAEGASSPDRDDVRKHLDYIQAIVTRMSSASSGAKGWLLPVVTATYGYSLTKHAESVALLGLLAVLLFALLDANYLRQERAFRALYDAVASNSRPVPLFSLDPTHALAPPSNSPPSSWRERVWFIVKSWFPERSVWASWSIAPFYGAFLAVGVVVFVVAR